MLRYLTTVKLFGGAAVILTLALSVAPTSAKNLNVYPINAAGQSIAGAAVCLGLSATTVNKGPQTTGSGGTTTFTNVSETQQV